MAKKIQHKELSQRCYEAVRDIILTSELRPGQRIVEDRLARELGVSRTPLKRALTRLKEDGLVVRVLRRGTYVREFSLKDALSAYDVREVIEGLAARLAASFITDKQIQGLRKVLEKAAEFVEEDSFSNYRKADLKFHELIAQASGNEMISQIITNFRLRVRSFNVGLIRPPFETLKEHWAIIDAVARHEADLAEKLVRAHIRASREMISSREKILKRRTLTGRETSFASSCAHANLRKRSNVRNSI